MENLPWNNNNQYNQIRKELEKRYIKTDANESAEPTTRTRLQELSHHWSNIVEDCAKRLLESGESFSVFNHSNPKYFRDVLALACEFSGHSASSDVTDPENGHPVNYRYLVGLQFEVAVNRRARELDYLY